ncbi:MAG: hypothetical protein AMXMBFR34_15970 [Myxococcaceae bacterium]
MRLPDWGPTPRPLVYFLGISLIGWTIYLVNQPRLHTLGDLSRGWYSDHYAHMNACRAFLFGGVDVWQTPIAQALAPLTPEERAALPPEIRGGGEQFRLPTSTARKPIAVSWSQLPRPYPPGDFVAVLPVALLYQWTDLEFRNATRLLVWFFVLYAHLAVLFFARAAWDSSPPAVLATVLVYFEAIHWALEGFYDSIALVPLALFALFLSRRQWLLAVLAYSIAAFFHFRAFFFGPLALLPAWHLVQARAWKQWTRGQWLVAGVTALLSGLALWTFKTASAALSSFPLDNPVAWTGPWQSRVGLFSAAAICAGVFLYARAWRDLILAGWLLFMAVNLRQAFAWHALLLLPWLILRPAAADPTRQAVAEPARWAMVICLATLVFRNGLVPAWLALVP